MLWSLELPAAKATPRSEESDFPRGRPPAGNGGMPRVSVGGAFRAGGGWGQKFSHAGSNSGNSFCSVLIPEIPVFFFFCCSIFSGVGSGLMGRKWPSAIAFSACDAIFCYFVEKRPCWQSKTLKNWKTNPPRPSKSTRTFAPTSVFCAIRRI